MDNKPQMFLTLYFTVDGDDDRHVRRGEITTHLGDERDPPLNMQQMTYAAKMEFAKIIRTRNKEATNG